MRLQEIWCNQLEGSTRQLSLVNDQTIFLVQMENQDLVIMHLKHLSWMDHSMQKAGVQQSKHSEPLREGCQLNHIVYLSLYQAQDNTQVNAIKNS